MRPLMLKAKSSENFVPPQKRQILAVLQAWWSGVVWPPGRLGKKVKKVTNIVYFTYLPRSPRCSDRHQICSESWFPGRNQVCQILFQSVQGFWFCSGSNFSLSHRNEVSPLTQGLNYRSACDNAVLLHDGLRLPDDSTDWCTIFAYFCLIFKLQKLYIPRV